MSAMFQDVLSQTQRRSISFGIDGLTRPRAATVSMCRYIVPESPISKPTASPPTSPPSLILPPPGGIERVLSRSSSRLSCFDERLASSAPSTSQMLSLDQDSSLTFTRLFRTLSREAVTSSSDFTLLTLDETTPYEPQTRMKDFIVSAGMDDQADTSPCEKYDIEEEQSPQFSASPVLMSCLRDIARRPREF